MAGNRRKPDLIVDYGPESLDAIDLLRKSCIDLVKHDVRKFAGSCYADLPTTRAPSVIAPEGLFNGLSGVREYVALSGATDALQAPSESACW